MIKLQNISKYYYTDTSVTQALDNISLLLPDTGFAAITGESGSGKSTLLNIISGMDTFDDGEMYIDGEPTFQYDAADWEDYRRNKIGFVFQNYGLIDHYTVTENIIAALYIQNKEESEAAEKSRTYIELVGLKGLEDQKASELSSGQKQRLSIARALAKGTPVIVADEPTGNLDSDTSAQIIDIFKKLSEDHLIIMVTHNFEQLEGKVTQTIRLHDGELVSDITYKNENILNESDSTGENTPVQSREDKSIKISETKDKDSAAVTMKEPERSDTDSVKKKSSPGTFRRDMKTAFRFFILDARQMKGRTAMFIFFFLFTGIITFIFMGELFMNADDRITKRFNTSAFLNQSDRRLLARHNDGSAITSDDIKKIDSLKYVNEADKYDICGDIQYYSEKGRDYTFIYGDKKEDGSKVKRIKFYDTKKFMRSSDCLSSSRIKSGKNAVKRDEIVISGSKSAIGKKIRVYFKNKNIWNKGEYYYKDLKVTGVLKDRTDQIYFSPDLCTMLTAAADGAYLSVDLNYDSLLNIYNFNESFIPVIGDGLEDKDNVMALRGSENHKGETLSSNGTVTEISAADLFSGKARVHRVIKQANGIGIQDSEVLQAQFSAPENDKDAKLNDFSPVFIEISEESFNRFYPDRMVSSQAAVYIRDYTKTDRVIKSLSRIGFDSISTYRVSTTKYVRSKVMDRFVTICISAGVLILIIILEILIVRSLMKIKISEFMIFRFMGMRMSVIKKISETTLFMYDIVTALFIILAAAVMSLLHVPFISRIFRYYSVINIMIFLLFGIILSQFTALSFNRLVKVRAGRK